MRLQCRRPGGFGQPARRWRGSVGISALTGGSVGTGALIGGAAGAAGGALTSGRNVNLGRPAWR